MAQLDPGLVVESGAEGGDDLLGAAFDAEHVLVIPSGIALNSRKSQVNKSNKIQF